MKLTQKQTRQEPRTQELERMNLTHKTNQTGTQDTDRATLLSEASVGGRAFLSAIPSGRTQMEPAVFVAEVRARLRVAEMTRGARFAMPFSIAMAIMPGCVPLEENEPSATMPFRTWCMHGASGAAFAQNGSGPTCFCPAIPRMSPTMLPGAALLTCTCLLSQGLLLPSTAPSHATAAGVSCVGQPAGRRGCRGLCSTQGAPPRHL